MVMQLCDVYLALGEERFHDLLKRVSLGRLRTYQLFERFRVRCHLNKLNTEHLRKAAPRLWARLNEKDDELAQDLSQGILISNLDMIIEILDYLGVPHQDGFFSKDIDPKQYLTGEWREKVYGAFKDKYPPSVLLFYLNHLAAESTAAEEVYQP
jgi:hypothetical protein